MDSRDSSSSLFEQRLRAVGYDGPVDQRALQALFKDVETVAFMEEVLSLLIPDYVLTAEELTKFKELESEGHVLHSETLQKELATARHRNAAVLFPDDNQQEADFVSEYSELVRRRVQLLEAQRDQLSHSLSSVKEKSSQLSPAIENAKQEREEALQKSREENALINQAVGDLQKSACELVDLHTFSHSAECKDQPYYFLAHEDFSDYEVLESKYMEALTGYTKKQFFDGVAKLTGHEEGSRYELLDVSDTDSLLVKGESETVKAGYSRELARLQSVYALSHSQRVDALAAQAKVNGACQCFNDQIQSIDHETSKDTEMLQ
jgi:HAUS augmin-like complex subunit 3